MTPGDPSLYAIKTWRYLRLAIVAVVIGLGVAVAAERLKVTPGCFQTSISAYFYTPVRGYFVGALIGIAVCLVCLRGSTDTEDVLLNLAGMFAPIVAFVPTPSVGSCTSVHVATQGLNKSIANNMIALLAVGALGLVVGGIMIARDGDERTPSGLIAYAAAITIWVATTLVFALARYSFVRNAHYIAAVLMFLCILAVAVVNAVDYKSKRPGKSLKNRYTAIAAAMVASSVVIGIAGALGWRYWIIVIEATLISLFAVFWVTQTWELWTPGLRVEEAAVGDGHHASHS
jgi:hypothetical protein